MMVWILAAAAFLGATISAIAGIGGGTVLIAAMFAVGLAPAVALPLHAVVQLASNASRALAYRPHIHWSSVGWFSLCCLPLPFLTAQWVAAANPDVIRLLLALAILLSLLPKRWQTLQPSSPRRAQWPLRRKMCVAGALNGAVGMFIGASGLIIGPFFLDSRWSKETTVGTLAMCQSVGHSLKIIAFGMIGYGLLEHWSLAWPMMLAVALGTLLGRALMRRVSAHQFGILFKLILVSLALRLSWVSLAALIQAS